MKILWKVYLLALALACVTGATSAARADEIVLPQSLVVAQAAAQPAPTTAVPVVTTPARPGLTFEEVQTPSRNSGFYATAGILYLQPVWQSNPSTLMITSTSSIGDSVAINNNDFNWDMRASPELIFGYKGDSGFGGRIRWWEFDQGNRQVAAQSSNNDQFLFSAAPLGLGIIMDPGAGGVLLTETGLAITVWDFELTQDVELGAWTLVFGGGLRYAHLAQHYNAFEIGGEPRGVFGNELRSSHNFNGIGPEVSFEAHRQLGGSGFGVYTNGRGALLFGTAKQSAIETGDFGLVDPTLSATHSSTDIRPVGELEIGVEYQRCLGRRATGFFQIGLNSQIWFNAGNASRSAGGSAVFFGPFLGSNAGANDNLGLIGLAFRTGIHF
jgi:hypothetical protein